MSLSGASLPERQEGGSCRVGVLGGTFDPIHNGHLGIAEAAQAALGLARVIFVPAGRPWIKAGGPGERGAGITPAGIRLDMVGLALEGHAGWEVSTVDIDRPGPSYSVDTVTDLRAAGWQDAVLFLILGADALVELPRWRDPQRLVEICTLICVGRPGSGPPACLPADHPGRGAVFVPGPMLDITATGIRAMVAAGQPVDGLVPAPVADYIAERGLYRPARGANRWA